MQQISLRLPYSSRVLLSFLILVLSLSAAPQPAVGGKAPDFELRDAVSGNKVRLSGIPGPVALVVLRGYPGYQCPYCTRQVQDFTQKAAGFAAKGVRVVFVYPGPPASTDKDLNKLAGEFLAGRQLPEGFQMLLDPGYEFTSQYGLRWDQPMETAYPSIFLIDRNGELIFSRIVKSHGGRASAQEILDLLPAPRKAESGARREKP